jgi:hypothetical protein
VSITLALIPSIYVQSQTTCEDEQNSTASLNDKSDLDTCFGFDDDGDENDSLNFSPIKRHSASNDTDLRPKPHRFSIGKVVAEVKRAKRLASRNQTETEAELDSLSTSNNVKSVTLPIAPRTYSRRPSFKENPSMPALVTEHSLTRPGNKHNKRKAAVVVVPDELLNSWASSVNESFKDVEEFELVVE